MKLVLMADNYVGQAVYDYLAMNFPEDIAMVVTVTDNILYNKARDAGFHASIFVSEDTLFDDLCRHKLSGMIDIGILAWWPKILHEPIITFPRQGFINFHPSLLPYNRGKHYNFWALVEQSPFGVTLHFIDGGIDKGDIIAQHEIFYDWTDTGASLYHKAQQEILNLFYETYPKIRIGEVCRIRQDHSKGSFHLAKEIEFASQLEIDKTYLARDLLNLIRARTFPGHPACYFFEKGHKYEVRIEIKKIEL